MHPDDAVRAHSGGRHHGFQYGARQFDNAPSPLEVLPAICDAVGNMMTVMLDGGIRRGLDVLNQSAWAQSSHSTRRTCAATGAERCKPSAYNSVSAAIFRFREPNR
ncbi:alpha-hydroxy-acid oxidizing protein [Bradyrhizobium sp. BWC-3-1]|uniref:alpha-hydroxy-acid oxidizing protein n=1 Tax=Bradyrhizobium sp. BWC-3-1 TaxID=3080012 RepID=UPI00293E5262|nr:alpha-hydroxy-acid oxidizing protein [Bradyrhizobium sp. BWC-3-1]WOH57671.1 alpha-hydroxy-acid oxidizing protein [Bradyrhizobium sp. BWC-3-1]